MYGEGFTFVEEVPSLDRYTMRVTRCFYHEFFTAQGQPQLTRLFCAWDLTWINEVSEQKHGVRFERSTTIAADGPDCPFTSHRVNADQVDG